MVSGCQFYRILYKTRIFQTGTSRKTPVTIRLFHRQSWIQNDGDDGKPIKLKSFGKQKEREKETAGQYFGTSDGYHQDRYDFVIFGATGVTGQYVVEEMTRLVQKEDSKFRMAVAGRNENRLRKVLETISNYTGNSIHTTPVLIADTNNDNSLKQMCRRAKVLLNCVGPYYIHGEQVVKACIETGTHHLDVSGEPLFLEKVQLAYDKEAKGSGVYIIGGCGAPSVLNDLGAHFTRKAFEGDVNSINSYMTFKSKSKGLSFNVTTFLCALNGFARASELAQQRKQLFQYQRPEPKYRKNYRRIGFDPRVGLWSVQWPGCDRSIIKRTLEINQHANMRTPFQTGVYVCFDSFSNMVLTTFYGYTNMQLAKYGVLREFISKHPEIFTHGKFRRGGPTREQVQDSMFSITIVAEGWKDCDSIAGNTPPNQQLVTKISGPEVAYVSSAICLVQCGITLLSESDKLPDKGGVYTVASAFSSTALVKRLNKRGITFEVTKQQEMMPSD